MSTSRYDYSRGVGCGLGKVVFLELKPTAEVKSSVFCSKRDCDIAGAISPLNGKEESWKRSAMSRLLSQSLGGLAKRVRGSTLRTVSSLARWGLAYRTSDSSECLAVWSTRAGSSALVLTQSIRATRIGRLPIGCPAASSSSNRLPSRAARRPASGGGSRRNMPNPPPGADPLLLVFFLEFL